MTLASDLFKAMSGHDLPNNSGNQIDAILAALPPWFTTSERRDLQIALLLLVEAVKRETNTA